MYFSTKFDGSGSVPYNEPFPLQSTDPIWLSLYWLRRMDEAGQRPRLWACDAVAWTDKETWIRGVKDSCER